MLRFKTPFILLILFSAALFAGQDVDPNAPQLETLPSSAVSDRLVVHPVRLAFDGNDVILVWSPFPNVHKETGYFLSGYRIYCSQDPNDLKLLSTTVRHYFRHRKARAGANAFYRVFAEYSERPYEHRLLRYPRRDDVVLLDFEDEELDLQPYNEDEDIDPDDWEITDEETLPESEHSLRLYGNTWKRLSVESIELTDSTVWSIGIRSIDGDTLADLQAFGFSDGEHELYYVFHGMRSPWEEPWIVVYQDINIRDQWYIYRMAVGYDWNIRYGYLPEIDELYFINDNDSNDTPSDLYFDELIDITESILPEPIPVVSWRYLHGRFEPAVVGMGGAVAFSADVENREPEEITYRWDFGDGRFSDEQNPTHLYHYDGTYTAGLTVRAEEGKIGRARINVEIGEIREPTQITAGFTGDVMLARRYEGDGGIITRFGPEAVFERIQPRFAELDLRVINLESLLTDEGVRHPTKGIAFRGSPENVAGLTFAGVDIAALANNHVIDYGRRGLEDTQEILDSAGIGHCGAGMNEYEALQPVFSTVRGIRIGVLSYCNRTGRDYNERPFMDAGYDRYGYAYFSGDNIERSVPDAAEQCDLLVVYVHGGWEYEDMPCWEDPDELYPPDHEERIRFTVKRDSATIELEHLAIDLGAGLVIGHHPHVLQGFEVYNGVVIAHSLGNFAFDQNFFETWPSALVCADISRDGVEKVWVEPFFVDNYYPTQAIEGLGRKILDRLVGYSTELSTFLVPDYDNMRAEIAIDLDRVSQRVTEHTVSGQMRYIEDDEVYRSEPLRLDGGGFPSRIVNINADVRDPQWRVSLGREILLVGNMEQEGAQIWNYNSPREGADTAFVHGGSFSSFINLPANFPDYITDLKQRIPVDAGTDRLILCGWMRTENANNAGLVVRYYRYRYSNDPRYIYGDQVVERRLHGDNDWTFLWDQLVIPENTAHINLRWQLYGPNAGQGWVWLDDVEIIRWEEFEEFGRGLNIDSPTDLYYLQVETPREVEEVEVTYRTVRIEY